MELCIGSGAYFHGAMDSNLSVLGAAIGKNSYLKKLEIGSEGLYLLSRERMIIVYSLMV